MSESCPLVGGAGHGQRVPITKPRYQVAVYDDKGRAMDFYELAERPGYHYRFLYRRRGWRSPRADFET